MRPPDRARRSLQINVSGRGSNRLALAFFQRLFEFSFEELRLKFRFFRALLEEGFAPRRFFFQELAGMIEVGGLGVPGRRFVGNHFAQRCVNPQPGSATWANHFNVPAATVPHNSLDEMLRRSRYGVNLERGRVRERGRQGRLRPPLVGVTARPWLRFSSGKRWPAQVEKRRVRYFCCRLPGLTAGMPDLQRGQSAGL